MAPFHSRQLLTWTLPTVAILLSYLWYKKKRIGAQSDPGDTNNLEQKEKPETGNKAPEKDLKTADKIVPVPTTPNKSFSRSLSGVESTPIDIVLPVEVRATKSTSVVISDEDLDLEIEKIKSMRSGPLFGSIRTDNSPPMISKSKTPSPMKEQRLASFKISPKKENKPMAQKDVDLVEEEVTSMTITDNKDTPLQEERSDSAEINRDHVELQQQQSNEKERKDTPEIKTEHVEVQQQSSEKGRKGSSKISRKHVKSQRQGSEKERNDRAEINREHVKVQRQTSERKRTDSREHVDLQRQSSERDSANHSPADVMLASPSLSSISDNHSEGSSDSGKGGSDVATPPPSNTPGIDVPSNVFDIFEFAIPQSLAGKLIGKHGHSLAKIKKKTKATFFISPHPINNEMEICSVEGTQTQIAQALKMVRACFPLDIYPEVTLEPLHLNPVTTLPLDLSHLYVNLIEGINNDTVLSCLVAPNHLFLQQPTHPSFPNLHVLSNYMNDCYMRTESPLLPNPIPENTVCVAYSVNSWCRAMVLSSDVESNTSYIKFLDYGGYAYVENSQLRQIRGDFMLSPFQAAECILANVRSLNEDGSWPEEAYNLVTQAAVSRVMYTQVADYTEDGIPLVSIFIVVGSREVIYLNQHLVENGFAEWIPSENAQSPLQLQDCTEGAVGGIIA